VEDLRRDEGRRQRIADAKRDVFRQYAKGEIVDRAVLINAEAADQVQRHSGEQQPPHRLLKQQLDISLASTGVH
jgi:hypothetical protein